MEITELVGNSLHSRERSEVPETLGHHQISPTIFAECKVRKLTVICKTLF